MSRWPCSARTFEIFHHCGGLSDPYDSGQSGTASPASLLVTNAPAETSRITKQARTTANRWMPLFGGLCSDLLNPVILGSAIADANGTAVHTFTPGDLSGMTVYSQAITQRGPQGNHSLKTNVLTDAF